MEAFPIFMMFIYGLFWAACFVALIYFIIQRVEAKKKEDFEKRDN